MNELMHGFSQTLHCALIWDVWGILGCLSVLPCFTPWIGSSEGPCPQMCLVPASNHSALHTSGHLCGGEELKEESLASVKTVTAPALPWPLPPNPPNHPFTSRDHPALPEALPSPPSFPALPCLGMPQHSLYPKTSHLLSSVLTVSTHLLNQHILREYIYSGGHCQRDNDRDPKASGTE